MATKLARKDVPAAWSKYLPSSESRQRRIAELRELVARGAYKVDLEELAASLIRRGGLMHGAESNTVN